MLSSLNVSDIISKFCIVVTIVIVNLHMVFHISHAQFPPVSCLSPSSTLREARIRAVTERRMTHSEFQLQYISIYKTYVTRSSVGCPRRINFFFAHFQPEVGKIFLLAYPCSSVHVQQLKHRRTGFREVLRTLGSFIKICRLAIYLVKIG